MVINPINPIAFSLIRLSWRVESGKSNKNTITKCTRGSQNLRTPIWLRLGQERNLDKRDLFCVLIGWDDLYLVTRDIL